MDTAIEYTVQYKQQILNSTTDILYLLEVLPVISNVVMILKCLHLCESIGENFFFSFHYHGRKAELPGSLYKVSSDDVETDVLRHIIINHKPKTTPACKQHRSLEDSRRQHHRVHVTANIEITKTPGMLPERFP